METAKRKIFDLKPIIIEIIDNNYIYVYSKILTKKLEPDG